MGDTDEWLFEVALPHINEIVVDLSRVVFLGFTELNVDLFDNVGTLVSFRVKDVVGDTPSIAEDITFVETEIIESLVGVGDVLIVVANSCVSLVTLEIVDVVPKIGDAIEYVLVGAASCKELSDLLVTKYEETSAFFIEENLEKVCCVVDSEKLVSLK